MTTPEDNKCFTEYSQSISGIDLPARFTYPFYYQPHKLCVLAVEELQHYLQAPQSWQHNFGLGQDPDKVIGKMFGVLVVQKADGSLGYLCAFSGKLAEQNHIEGFVPPVFDMLAQDSFFLTEQVNINQLNQQINTLANSPELAQLQQQFDLLSAQHERDIAAQRALMIEQRKQRKTLRENAAHSLTAEAISHLNSTLDQQSIQDKLELRDLSQTWSIKLSKAQQQLGLLTKPLQALKAQRKAASANLQQKLFKQYRFLNILGQEQNLQDIFSQTALHTPPAGAGECAAPKLLHYAFKHQLKPIAMAEFWWGASPKSEIRQHKNVYPACLGKCQPILTHMLKGMAVDDNPMLVNPAAGKTLEIVYQDDVMVVVNKPADFLSVPGKDIQDSVYTRIQSQFPQAYGALIVHRLDMATSGLLVLALNPLAHKHLQAQFIQRSVKKTYVAMLEGLLSEDEGIIELPLRGDYYDRPRQLVCKEHGKPAETRWHLVERNHLTQQSKIILHPYTGRTHQLRVHCAHPMGLNMPIVGDDLYGTRGRRLHLHANKLELIHPITLAAMQFEVKADF
ncbi:RluA family pseudouridine synthase [Paraglaciecola sp. 25GB23A]|uniref:RluA family pseudouridine synthase n=1 Tax=Paraglaciecola sp. 25GB23A TaxID=3156068 RepID=UPI0032AEE64E